jgi:hypothetical protein
VPSNTVRISILASVLEVTVHLPPSAAVLKHLSAFGLSHTSFLDFLLNSSAKWSTRWLLVFSTQMSDGDIKCTTSQIKYKPDALPFQVLVKAISHGRSRRLVNGADDKTCSGCYTFRCLLLWTLKYAGTVWRSLCAVKSKKASAVFFILISIIKLISSAVNLHIFPYIHLNFWLTIIIHYFKWTVLMSSWIFGSSKCLPISLFA